MAGKCFGVISLGSMMNDPSNSLDSCKTCVYDAPTD